MGAEKRLSRETRASSVSLDNLRWLVWERFVGSAGKNERCVCVCVCVYRKTERGEQEEGILASFIAC